MEEVDKIEVGEYVRTTSGEIGKVRVIIDNMIFIGTNQYYHNMSNIKKHSTDKFDLLEVGDWVNKKLVHYVGVNFIEYGNGKTISRDEPIKSIVTKEKFSEVEYKEE